MKRIFLIIILLLVPLAVYGGEKFGMVFDVEGNVELKQGHGASIKLKKDRHILHPLKDGDRINVIGSGKIIIVSLKEKQGYEVTSNSSAVIEGGRIKAIKGVVNIKEGFHAPKEGADGPIGAVVLRGIIKEPCIKTLSPVNTAILSLMPELKWDITCKGLKKVSIKILAAREVIFNVETEGVSLKVPEGILRYGETYRWLVDAGTPYGIVGGTFSIPQEEEIKIIQEKLNSHKSPDLSQRLSYIFYLIENRLNEYAKSEIEGLEREFPENNYIRELKKGQ